MAPKRGLLIVLEGLDRSGKSTQCQRLVDHLRGQNDRVEHLRFPNRTTLIGQMINGYLSGQTQLEDHAIHLLFSANRWESAQDIERHIGAGSTVVIDRYYYSGCVYTASKQNSGMDLAWCRHPEVGLPRPDICLFLDLSSEEAASRGGFGSERYEEEELQARVRDLYAEMKRHEDEHEDIVTIDAGKGMNEVAQAIVIAVRQRTSAQESALRYVRPW